MKTSDLFIAALENEGVEYIFGVPGEENLDFLESLRHSKIKLILTRHEQGAGFMAATYGRLTGKPGVCLSTLGPGATNLLTAVAYAQLGAMPMMVITGQKPIKKSKQAKFQIIDVVDMMRPITKFTKQVVNGDNIDAHVRDCFRIAMEERPGAVHLELPEDIAAEEFEAKQPLPVVKNYIPKASDENIKAAARVINQAKKPLLLIGASGNRRRTSEALTHFIEQCNIPFFNTQMGKGVVDEKHSLFVGTAALSEGDFLHEAISMADLIVNVGHDVIEKPPFFMHRGGQQVVHINFFPAQVDPVYFPQTNVVGDIATSVQALSAHVQPRQSNEIDAFIKVKENVEQHLTKYEEDDRFPMLPQRIVSTLRSILNADDIITLDNGMYKIWFARNYRAYKQNTLLLDNALATMGAGLPSAMTAKMIHPDKTVIAVAGDGGFMMNSQELETAVRLNLNLVVIILNDSAYGMIKWKQEIDGFANYGLDFKNPDFVKYAESYGAHGHRPSNVAEFVSTVDSAIKTSGVHVIDLAIDYSLNHKILNEILSEFTAGLDN